MTKKQKKVKKWPKMKAFKGYAVVHKETGQSDGDVYDLYAVAAGFRRSDERVARVSTKEID